MSAQNKSAMWKFFPAIDNPTKASTAMCATVFDELDAALDLLNSARGDFNPLQRQLVGRFIAVCKVFGRDMLAADGNPDALRAVFGLSAGTPGDQADKPAGGRTLIDDVCTGACGDLERIGATVQGELLEGVADVMASIRASQEPGAPEGDALDAMASSVRELAHQVAALFEAQPYALRRHQLVYQADIEAAESDPAHQRGITVDEFLASIKPPIRRPTLRDRLGPYIPQLMKLRAHGYTYAQCAQFLRENGISTYPAAISSVLCEARSRTTEAGSA
jgi:hypothetical protein